jgi:uncharacterized protein YcbK (DUF882 family)
MSKLPAARIDARNLVKILDAVLIGALVTLGVMPAAAARIGGARPVHTVDAVSGSGPHHRPRTPSPADQALVEATGEALPPRDRLLAIENVNTGEKAVFNIGPGGYVRSDQAPALEHFLRCRRTMRENPIDPGVLSILADLAEHWPGRVIEIVSGFRAPPFGVPHSKHFIGHAIDLRMRGVPITEVRDYLWRTHQGVGVGYYPESGFVHVDSRPEAQEIAWSAKAESAGYQYNPAWAERIRRRGAGLPR